MNESKKSPRAPAPPSPARAACPGRTKAGRPCGATPTADGRCPNHSPKFTAEMRSAWGRRGALIGVKYPVEEKLEALAPSLPEPPGDPVPSYATAASTRQYLERMSKRVVDNKLAPSQAGAIARFAELAIKLAELELERDTLDLEIAAQERGDVDRRPRVRMVK